MSNALCYPDDVTTLLFLQLHVRIKHSKVKLIHERLHIELDFSLKELVLECLLSRISASTVEYGSILLSVRMKHNRGNGEEEEDNVQDRNQLQPSLAHSPHT